MIDNHGAFAGSSRINVAGGPLTVTVEAQKRCLDQDGLRLEKIVSWAAKRSSIRATSSALIFCSILYAVRMRLMAISCSDAAD